MTRGGNAALVLHLATSPYAAYVWAETASGQMGDHKAGTSPPHPFAAGADALQAMLTLLPSAGTPMRVDLHLLAAGRQPLPSPKAQALSIATSTRNRTPVGIRPFATSVLALPLSDLARGAWPPEDAVVLGDEWAAAKDLVDLARRLWRAGAVAPMLADDVAVLRPRYVGLLAVPAFRAEYERIAHSAPQALLAAFPPALGIRETVLREMLDIWCDALACVGEATPEQHRPLSFPSLPKAREGILTLFARGERPPIAPTPSARRLQEELRSLARQLHGSIQGPFTLLLHLDLTPARALLHTRLQRTSPAAHEASLLDWQEAVQARLLPREAFDAMLAAGGTIGHRLLAARPCSTLPLQDEELVEFLGGEAAHLRQAGLRVLLPRELLRRPQHLHIRARLGARQSGAGCAALYDADWDLILAGARLTPGELERLAHARRPIVELYGRYVQVSPEELRTAARLLRTAQRGGVALGDLLELACAPPEGGPELDLHADGELGSMLDAALGRPVAAFPRPLPPDLRCTLRSYQERGFAFLETLAHQGFGALLADDMGLGKTVQVLALLLACRDCGHGPSLVVTPTSVLSNWLRETARFAPGLRISLYHGDERRLPSTAAADVVLTSYGILARDAELAERTWHLAVFDEAQALKNPLSHASRAARRLSADSRIALTGTPIENRLLDLWSLFDVLLPGYLGGLRSFERHFARPIAQGDLRRGEELRRRIAPFMLRRSKGDPMIVPDLPPIVGAVEYTSLTPEQAALYRATLDSLRRRLEEHDDDDPARRGIVIAAITRLKLLIDHPSLLLREEAPLDPQRSGKLLRLFEILDQAISEGDRVLVYSQFARLCTRVAPLVRQRLSVPAALLTGALSRAERDAQIAMFHSAPGAAVFMLSLRAGGVGLNLQSAHRVIHLDRWWNPAVEDQATGRAHRIGQTHPVIVHSMVARGTLEERVHALLDEKRRLKEQIIGGEAAYLASLPDTELLQALALSEGER